MEQVIRYSLPIVAFAMIGIQYWMQRKIEDFPLAETNKEKKYLFIEKIILFLISIYLMFIDSSLGYFYSWKIICIIGLLLLIAFVDYKVQLIPNEFLAVGLVIRIVILGVEVLVDFAKALISIKLEMIGCVMMLLMCALLRVISRKGVGMGDIKLLAIFPLFLGIPGCFEAAFYAMIVIFIQACICLLTHKKDKKDVLPFAPAILIGVLMWTICLGL